MDRSGTGVGEGGMGARILQWYPGYKLNTTLFTISKQACRDQNRVCILHTDVDTDVGQHNPQITHDPLILHEVYLSKYIIVSLCRTRGLNPSMLFIPVFCSVKYTVNTTDDLSPNMHAKRRPSCYIM